ncbi:MAG: nucleotidyltransferase [Nitrososphaerota archaeon]|nr:nucleotidyltransferase [Nitrososphaerota archaeon]
MLTKTAYSSLLTAISQELDIPDHLHEEATLKYEEVGTWLAHEQSSLAKYSPDIYPQGSFRLGTVVRPIDPECDYDIDLVCVIEKGKESTTQADLKKLVGDRLREDGDYARRLSPSRRAWNLNFPKQFHMDVLPCIPNEEQDPNGILLTDTDLHNWQKSNPIDYSDWFYESMKVQVQEFRESLAKSMSLNVEEVPEWQVKTPLQRAIQILKRHRDMRFLGDAEQRPVSIILTTLAAQAYKGEGDVYDALLRVATDMPNYIQRRNDKWWVPNPVEPDENFADKWNEKPERRDAFLNWLQAVRTDFALAAQESDIDSAAYRLKRMLDGRTVDAARAKLFARSEMTVNFPGRPVMPGLVQAQHSQAPYWPTRQVYKASIKASLHYQQHGRRISELAMRKVAKNLWVKFVVETNAPRPYSVYWKVVNTGQEAAAQNQLRGSIFEGTVGSNVQWERTAYTGTHWVEAFVVKDGYLVASAARKYVLIR